MLDGDPLAAAAGGLHAIDPHRAIIGIWKESVRAVCRPSTFANALLPYPRKLYDALVRIDGVR